MLAMLTSLPGRTARLTELQACILINVGRVRGAGDNTRASESA
jgi:hypothetical protein